MAQGRATELSPLRLLKIYGVALTYAFANTAFLLFKVNTAIIDICNKGNCLRKIYMDGFILRYFLIKMIRVFNRAIFRTGRTTRAFILYNVSGFLGKGYYKVSCFAF